MNINLIIPTPYFTPFPFSSLTLGFSPFSLFGQLQKSFTGQWAQCPGKMLIVAEVVWSSYNWLYNF